MLFKRQAYRNLWEHSCMFTKDQEHIAIETLPYTISYTMMKGNDLIDHSFTGALLSRETPNVLFAQPPRNSDDEFSKHRPKFNRVRACVKHIISLIHFSTVFVCGISSAKKNVYFFCKLTLQILPVSTSQAFINKTYFLSAQLRRSFAIGSTFICGFFLRELWVR